MTPTEPKVDDTPFWQHTDGPNGGTVENISINSKGIVFISTASGVFRSSDGVSWTPKNSGLLSGTTTPLASDSSGNIYCAALSSGIAISADDGELWSQDGSGITGTVQALAASKAGHVFAGTSDGVFHQPSKDASWTKGSGIPGSVLSLAVGQNGSIFAGTTDNFYRSADDGISWSVSSSGLDAGEIHHIFAAQEGKLYTAVYNSSLTGGIYRSENNGDSWIKLSLGLNLPNITSLMVTHSGEIFAGIEYFSSTSTQNLFRSSDAGSSWTMLSSGFGSNWISALAEDTHGQILAGTWGSGMYISSNNGDQFLQSNSGLTTPNVYALTLSPAGMLYAGIDGGVSRSSDNGTTWAQVLSGDGRLDVTSVAVDSSGSVYAGTRGYGLYKSSDGISWFASWNPSLTGFSGGAITSIAANPGGVLFLNIIGWGGPYRSSNGGANFSKVDGNGGGGGFFSVDSTGAIYFAYGSVDVSSDAGITWQNLPGFAKKEVYSILRTGKYLIVASTSGIYRSDDNGKTSTQFSSPGEGASDIVANSNGVLFASSYGTGGVYRSTDHGETWVRINGGLINTSVESMTMDRNGYLYLGTSGGGVFRSIAPAK